MPLSPGAKLGDYFQNHVARVARAGDVTRISEPGHYGRLAISPDGDWL